MSRVKDWRVVYHYTGAHILVHDPASDDYTGETYVDPGKPINGTHVNSTMGEAMAFAAGIRERGGWAEVYYVPPDTPRKRRDWELIAQIPQVGADDVACAACGAGPVEFDAEFQIMPHSTPSGDACVGAHISPVEPAAAEPVRAAAEPVVPAPAVPESPHRRIASLEELTALGADSVVLSLGEFPHAYQRFRNGQWYTYGTAAGGVSSHSLFYGGDLILLYEDSKTVTAGLTPRQVAIAYASEFGWRHHVMGAHHDKFEKDGVFINVWSTPTGRLRRAARMTDHAELPALDGITSVFYWMKEEQ